jgi:hypothetical protein
LKFNQSISVPLKIKIRSMKKLSLLLVIVAGAFYSASAQYYNNAPQPKIGFGLSSGFAVGPVSSSFPEAGGISVNLELPVNKSQVSVLFSTGYTFYVAESGYSLDFYGGGYGASTYYGGDVASFVPIEAGLKINVAPKFFIEGLAGVSFNVNGSPSYYTGQTTAFIYSPGLGYSFPLGFSEKSNLDVSLMYENRVEPGGGYSQIAVKGVWNFSL